MVLRTLKITTFTTINHQLQLYFLSYIAYTNIEGTPKRKMSYSCRIEAAKAAATAQKAEPLNRLWVLESFSDQIPKF
jgi:hypothetical protein